MFASSGIDLGALHPQQHSPAFDSFGSPASGQPRDSFHPGGTANCHVPISMDLLDHGRAKAPASKRGCTGHTIANRRLADSRRSLCRPMGANSGHSGYHVLGDNIADVVDHGLRPYCANHHSEVTNCCHNSRAWSSPLARARGEKNSRIFVWRSSDQAARIRSNNSRVASTAVFGERTDSGSYDQMCNNTHRCH